MKAIVVANWKMNPATFAEAKKLLDETRKAAERCAKVSLTIAPPAIYARDLISGYRGAKVSFALQHARAEAVGAHTGDVSIAQGKDIGITSIIIGHAERRAQGETDVDTRAQVASALAAGMTPILCVGEKSRGDSGEHFEVVRAQLQTGLADAGSKIKKIIVAYEPVWSIGAETAMSPRDMHEMAIFIRKIIIDAHGEVGHAVKIIYGGSVDESNAIIMLKEGDVHGLLIGRASQDSKVFWSLLHAIENA